MQEPRAIPCDFYPAELGSSVGHLGHAGDSLKPLPTSVPSGRSLSLCPLTEILCHFFFKD